MRTGKFAYTSSELESGIGGRLMDLFTLPTRAFELPVETEDGNSIGLEVKIRLLNDKENLEVSEISDRFGVATTAISQRRAILARAIVSIERLPLEMPAVLVQDLTERLGRSPTEVEQRFWVLEQCQGVLLQQLITFYYELQDEQINAVNEIKKKFEQRTVVSQQRTSLLE